MNVTQWHWRTARSRDVHVRQFHSFATVEEISDAASSLNHDDQFQATAAQLAPDPKEAGFIQPSFNSAFSRIVGRVCFNKNIFSSFILVSENFLSKWSKWRYYSFFKSACSKRVTAICGNGLMIFVAACLRMLWTLLPIWCWDCSHTWTLKLLKFRLVLFGKVFFASVHFVLKTVHL